jgi:hypothetical protein
MFKRPVTTALKTVNGSLAGRAAEADEPSPAQGR